MVFVYFAASVDFGWMRESVCSRNERETDVQTRVPDPILDDDYDCFIY
jgi:hypothetical protein